MIFFFPLPPVQGETTDIMLELHGINKRGLLLTVNGVQRLGAVKEGVLALNETVAVKHGITTRVMHSLHLDDLPESVRRAIHVLYKAGPESQTDTCEACGNIIPIHMMEIRPVLICPLCITRLKPRLGEPQEPPF